MRFLASPRGLLSCLVTLHVLRPGSDGFRVVAPGQPLRATVGQDVVLPCHVSPRVDIQSLEIWWVRHPSSEKVHHYWNGEDLYGEQSRDYWDRTELVRAGLANGSLDLRLRGLRPSDDGQYLCAVQGVTTYNEDVVALEVSATGSDPQLSLEAHEDGGIRVRCRSAGWYPEPQVLWKGPGGQRLPSRSQRRSSDQRGLFHVEDVAVVSGSGGGNVSCVVRNSRLAQEQEASLHISAPFFHDARPWMVALPVLLVLLVASWGLGAWLWRRRGEFVLEGAGEGLGAGPGPARARGARARGPAPCPGSVWPPWSSSWGRGGKGPGAGLWGSAGSAARAPGGGSAQRPSADGAPGAPSCSPDPLPLPLLCSAAAPRAGGHSRGSGVFSQTPTCGDRDLYRICQLLWEQQPEQKDAALARPFPLGHARALRGHSRGFGSFPNPKEQQFGLCPGSNSSGGSSRGVRVCPLCSRFFSFSFPAERDQALAWRKFLLPENPDVVTLDPETAHPQLVLSPDRRRVSWQKAEQHLPCNIKRFRNVPCVLGREGFKKGRHCWEVAVQGEVAGDALWGVGVVRDSVNRDGNSGLSPDAGVWAVRHFGNEFQSHTVPPNVLSPSPVPRRILVCLDCTERLLTFINAETGAEIFTFPPRSLDGKFFRPWFWVTTEHTQLCLRGGSPQPR
ncbi:butyrophilin subfamily 1 member A1-like [Athene noctua]|uniref:butyrophilin subfamily 1 member A1-like n=1 Tax=Athene noctua TaxID=126797 RepID=UPI003EBDB246